MSASLPAPGRGGLDELRRGVQIDGDHFSTPALRVSPATLSRVPLLVDISPS